MAKVRRLHKMRPTTAKLNGLRAAVLGANDGIVSVSAIILGVGGAGITSSVLITAGLAGLVAGALSMAVGEYVSVSSERDSEKAFNDELHKVDAAEIGDGEKNGYRQIDEKDFNNPAQAAFASFVSFIIGGLIPLVAAIASSAANRLITTFVAVIIALIVTGYLSATFGQSSRLRAIVRVVTGGVVAMLVTYVIGFFFSRVA